jgi:hypothetical protein
MCHLAACPVCATQPNNECDRAHIGMETSFWVFSPTSGSFDLFYDISFSVLSSKTFNLSRFSLKYQVTHPYRRLVFLDEFFIWRECASV